MSCLSKRLYPASSRFVCCPVCLLVCLLSVCTSAAASLCSLGNPWMLNGYSTPPLWEKMTLPMLPLTVSHRRSVITLWNHSQNNCALLRIKMLRSEPLSIWGWTFYPSLFAVWKRQQQLHTGCEWHVMTLTWIPCLNASFEVHSDGSRLPFC